MTDWLIFPDHGFEAQRQLPQASPWVRWWLWLVAALVLAMVIVGGATRLTESGLSITEWKPVTGVLPPLSEAQWLAEFEKYKQIPQYQQLAAAMDLAGFKFIYFWEWGHRLLGRVIGIVFALPLLWFVLRRQLPAGFGWKLLGLLFLGGLQGFVGWWMVKSGLSVRVEVSQYRLSVQLLLASLTFAALVWLATSLSPRQASGGGWRWLASFVILLVLLQIGLGALVAGLRAGLVYNTWPLMGESFVPPLAELTSQNPLWTNLFENHTTVQFLHRMTAYAMLAFALVQALASGSGPATRRAWALAGLVLCQAGLGIATLLLAVPLWTALLHQAFAMLVLGMAVVHRQRLSPAASRQVTAGRGGF